MSTTLQILDKEELSKRLAMEETWFTKQRQKLEPPDTLAELARTTDSRFSRSGESERGYFMRGSLTLARMFHALGKPPKEIRSLLHEGVRAFIPVVPLFNFWSEKTLAVLAKDVKRYDGGKFDKYLSGVFLPPALHNDSRHKTIRVSIREQPAQTESEEALIAALIAWDFEAVEKIASSYDLCPAAKGDGVNRFGLLREAVLGNTNRALAFLANVPKGYDADFPPKQRELAEGVIRGDASLVRAGLKSIAKRFETAWTLKTYSTPTRLQRAGTLESLLPEIRKHLIGHKWLLSDWGVAWMSLAWHREMKDAFSEPNLFNEWVPWELCCPE